MSEPVIRQLGLPWWIGIALGSLIVGSTITGCSQSSEAPPAKQPVQKIKTVILADPTALIGRTFPGTVRATQRVELSFEVPGSLRELPVVQGQRVAEGELLARLDARDYQNQVDAARAEYQKAQANFRRSRELVDKGHVSRADHDQTVARRDVTSAELAKAEKALERTAIRAPFRGVVARRYVENYTDVRAKQPVLSLQDLQQLELVVDAPENIVVLRGGQPTARLEATLAAVPGRSFPVTIKEYATVADPKTQTFEYVFNLGDLAGANVLPGMNAEVAIVGLTGDKAKQNSFSVPASAVVNEPGEPPYVWVIETERNTAQRRLVVLDEPDGSAMVTVREGLAAGDVVATAGAHHLTEGMQVIPVARIRF